VAKGCPKCLPNGLFGNVCNDALPKTCPGFKKSCKTDSDCMNLGCKTCQHTGGAFGSWCDGLVSTEGALESSAPPTGSLSPPAEGADKVVDAGPVAFAEAGNLAVSFHDCGDASTDAVVKDVIPKTIVAGSTTTITGSGTLKRDITGATYSMTMTGILSTVLVKDCSGDAGKAQTCDIIAPLLGKVGSLAYQPVTFPIKAGDVTGIPKVAVTLKAGLPASLETTTTTLKVTASNGDKAICVQIMTKAAATPLVVVV
jgi:hypothetical protein